MSQWWNYVVRIAGTDEQKRIADDSKIGTTVISRWFKGHNEPSAKLVVSFARAHNRPPVEALIAAGYLDESDASDTVEVHRGLDGLSDDELLAEVRRRMRGERNVLEANAAAGASSQTSQEKEDLAALSPPEIDDVTVTESITPDLGEHPEDTGSLGGSPGGGGDVEEDGPDAAAQG